MQPLACHLLPQEDLFRHQLDNLLDSRHELYRLAQQIPWAQWVWQFGPLYADRGRPGLPIRLLVGLQYLKHLYALSDEEVVARLVENPYWQYFCGEVYIQHALPINPSPMTRFSQRIGEAGCEWLLKLTIEVGWRQRRSSRPICGRSLGIRRCSRRRWPFRQMRDYT